MKIADMRAPASGPLAGHGGAVPCFLKMLLVIDPLGEGALMIPLYYLKTHHLCTIIRGNPKGGAAAEGIKSQ